MRIKAKSGYKNLSDTENFLALGSASKHTWLLRGLEVTITDAIKLPKKIQDNVTIIKEKKEAK